MRTMPSFSTEVHHSLGQVSAQDRLSTFLERMVEQYQDHISQVEGAWDGNVLNYSLTTFGMTISGKLTVAEDRVQANGELPLAAIMFKGRITEGVREALQSALA
jgi:hypothetical protein